MNYKFILKNNYGFFSDFNIIIGCLNYIINNQIDNYTFIWNNILYQSNQENLFNKIFFKTNEYNFYDKEINASSIGCEYYSQFNPREKFINSYNILNYFNYFNNPYYLDLKNKCKKQLNTLGVHVRGTDHWQHAPILDIDIYFQYIDKKLESGKYTNIFIATDETRYIEKFQKKYGKKIIFNDNILRSNTSISIHHNNFLNKEKLIEDVMLDAISLSECEEIIITSSNVSAYTLALNPNIKYTFIDYNI